MYFFPTPYDDELLYSVLARYCRQSGNINAIHNMDDIFGSRNIVASPELPGKIDMLIANLPVNSKFTSEYFILNHTIFPYIASFLPENRAREVQGIMKNGKLLSLIYNKSGYISSDINQNTQFRFCSECMKEDIQNFGETYWHRLHQVTGVIMCPIHKTLLYDSSVSMRGAYRQSFIPANEDNCIPKNIRTFSDEVSVKLILVAEDIQKVLKQEFTYQSVNKHKFICIQKLIDMKYANLNGMVHQKKLRMAMLDFWGDEVLLILI